MHGEKAVAFVTVFHEMYELIFIAMDQHALIWAIHKSSVPLLFRTDLRKELPTSRRNNQSIIRTVC